MHVACKNTTIILMGDLNTDVVTKKGKDESELVTMMGKLTRRLHTCRRAKLSFTMMSLLYELTRHLGRVMVWHRSTVMRCECCATSPGKWLVMMVASRMTLIGRRTV